MVGLVHSTTSGVVAEVVEVACVLILFSVYRRISIGSAFLCAAAA